MKKDMERELLNWRKREFRLRKKYWDTPCGFQGRREKRRCLEELFRAEKEYWKKKEHRLETCWEPEEEVRADRGNIPRRKRAGGPLRDRRDW